MTSNGLARETVAGPVPGDPALLLANYDVADLGYVCEEYFVQGTAPAFRIGDGGVAEAGAGAEYRTRIVVVRPADSAAFNGTVAVEWLNVSAGRDAPADWYFIHRYLARHGIAWVGVSAQKAGLEGGNLFGGGYTGMRGADPERYASLSHPGDAYSFGIFANAGDTVRRGGFFGDAEPSCLIAMGSSQSAAYLIAYINHVDRYAPVYDAYLVAGRGSKGADLTGNRLRFDAGPPRDLDEQLARQAMHLAHGDPIVGPRVPVITMQAETDVVPRGGYAARAADGDRTRFWEIAGTAHGDGYLLVAAREDNGLLPIAELARLSGPTDEPLGLKSEHPINAALQQHYVMHAAVAHLESWARKGTPPPTAAYLDTVDAGAGICLSLDENGLATGGIRSPWVDVPIAEMSGMGGRGPDLTALFGITRPFSREKIDRLYPGGVEDYLSRFTRSLDQAIGGGFLLDEDRAEILALARATWDY